MSEKTAKFLKLVRVAALLSIGVMVAISLWAWGQVPAGTLVPIHWGVSGKADGFAPKEVALWMIPPIVVFVSFVFDLAIRKEQNSENMEKSLAVAGASMFGTLALMVVVHALIVFGATGQIMPVAQVVSAGVGLLLTAVGGLIAAGKTSRNTSVGVRTPWTLSSDKAWAVTSRFSGSVMLLMGLGAILAGVINSMSLMVVSLLFGVVVLLFGSYAVSYFVSRSEKQAP
jgi:uncharacterized membrane protein